MLDYLRHISPALITVIGGGYLLTRFFVGRANFAALVERTCEVLNQLCGDCAEYWCVDTPSDDAEKIKHSVLEGKIKAGVFQVNALVTLMGDKIPSLPTSIRAMILDLADACTGGEFESSSRKANKQQFMRIAINASKIAVELHRLKIWTPTSLRDIEAALDSRDNRSGRFNIV
jgi:hypothetical protein